MQQGRNSLRTTGLTKVTKVIDRACRPQLSVTVGPCTLRSSGGERWNQCDIGAGQSGGWCALENRCGVIPIEVRILASAHQVVLDQRKRRWGLCRPRLNAVGRPSRPRCDPGVSARAVVCRWTRRLRPYAREGWRTPVPSHVMKALAGEGRRARGRLAFAQLKPELGSLFSMAENRTLLERAIVAGTRAERHNRVWHMGQSI